MARFYHIELPKYVTPDSFAIEAKRPSGSDAILSAVASTTSAARARLSRAARVAPKNF